MIRFLSLLRVAFAVVVFFTAAAQAQDQVDLTLPQAREVARQALFADQPTLALQIAETILSQVPDDRTALLIVAAAAPRVGDPARGRAAGQAAFRLSDTDAERYEAARLIALAAASEERFTLATFWLRRALTVAPNEEERARTLQDARTVSRANPWSSSLSFSLAPSNNVNGGAEEEELRIEGENTGGTISESGLALSGWRGSLGVGVQYRFQENARSRSTVGLSYQGSRVRITESTDVKDEALRTDALQFTLRHERALEEGLIGFTLSQSNYTYRTQDSDTGDLDVESYDTTRFSVDRRIPVADRGQVTLSASHERLTYTVDAFGQLDRNSVGGGFRYRLDSRDVVGADLRIDWANGDNSNLVSDAQTLSVSYSWADPFGPVTLSAGAGVTLRNYPDFEVFDLTAFDFVPLEGGRDDTRIFANLNIGFPDVSYAGFTPGLRIDAARTRSNVSRYDQTVISAGFTISSSF